MKILVTGAAGNVGNAVAHELLNQGHQVRLLDVGVPAPELRDRCEVVYCDLQDRLGLMRAMEGIEAVAHLAAIPNPIHNNDKILFAPNVLGTQMLLEVAAEFGVKRFAFASSCSIYGMPFQPGGEWGQVRENPIEPQYLPIDTAHPILSEDVYALSKECNEITAAMYTRRTGMATTCLRLTHVVDLARRRNWMMRHLQYAHTRRSSDLWAYVERRDVARAFCLSLEKVESGHHVLVICAQDVLLNKPIREAVEKHYPKLLPFLDNGFDYQTYGCWDTRPAQQLLGWSSQFHWRDVISQEELA